MRVLHAGDLGVILSARRESVFAYRLSSETATWGKDRARVLRGLAHLGIAAYAYPHPDDLHDPSVRYVDALPCEDFIRRACAQLRARADEVAQGGAEAQDRNVDLALAAGLDTAWAEWDRCRPPTSAAAAAGRAGSRRSRPSTGCCVPAATWSTTAWRVRSARTPTAGSSCWSATGTRSARTPRLEGYQALSALARVDTDLPDPRDPRPGTRCPVGHPAGRPHPGRRLRHPQRRHRDHGDRRGAVSRRRQRRRARARRTRRTPSRAARPRRLA